MQDSAATKDHAAVKTHMEQSLCDGSGHCMRRVQVEHNHSEAGHNAHGVEQPDQKAARGAEVPSSGSDWTLGGVGTPWGRGHWEGLHLSMCVSPAGAAQGL